MVLKATLILILLPLAKLLWKYLIIKKVLEHKGPVDIQSGSLKNGLRIKKEK